MPAPRPSTRAPIPWPVNLPADPRLCDNGAMQLLDLTLPTPHENLALDEALLDWAEEISPPVEVLRLWESPQPLCVVGRSSRIDQEVDASACRERGIPILRRSSGGAAILTGPGCLMYAVVLSYELRPDLKDISRAHSYALGCLAKGLSAASPKVLCAGTSDLVIFDESKNVGRKISGNSLRAKRSHLLYHGTLLYNFDLSLITECLQMPPRQPNYRGARGHADFVANLPISSREMRECVLRAFPTNGQLASWPKKHVAQLIEDRFSRENWNLRYPQ